MATGGGATVSGRHIQSEAAQEAAQRGCARACVRACVRASERFPCKA